MPLNSPLCRIGRKKPLLSVIKAKAPKDFSIYIEPFLGSGDVFFGLNIAPDEVKSYLNDKDTLVTNSFKIMKANPNNSDIDKFKNLSLEQVRAFVKTSPSRSIDRLAKYIYLSCGTFGSKGEGKIYKNPNIEPKLRRLPELSEYLKNSHITNGDWSTTFKHDSPHAFFYLDPPYEDKGEGDLYKHGAVNYETLSNRLSKLKGKFLLSVNDSKEMRKVFKDFKIRGVQVETGFSNKLHQEAKASGTKRKELLIKNY